MIRLRIDDRERRSPVPAALAALGGFDLRIEHLDCGDYLLDDALLIERKTLPDLVQSILDGRLFAQSLRLAEARLPAALILEGTGADLAASGLRREAIQGALVTVALFIGLPVLRSATPLETARTLKFIAEQRATVAAGALPRKGRRPKGKRALQSYILQGLPGIGPRRAAAMLDRFGSVAAAIAADPDALSDVAGIGPQVARKLRWSVEEPRTRYG